MMQPKKLTVRGCDGITVRDWLFGQAYNLEEHGEMGAVLKCHNGVPFSLAYYQKVGTTSYDKSPRITLKGEELIFFFNVFRVIFGEDRIIADCIPTAETEVTFEGERSEEADGAEVPESDIQREGG